MRFILQLFYAPAIRSVADAQAMTARRRQATPSHRARFSGFIEAAAVIQPGLHSPQLDDAVLVVSLPEAPSREDIIRLARAAAMAGLHLLDPHRQILYRSDGCRVHADGGVEPMPAPPAASPPAWSKTAVEALASRRLAQCLDAHGFVGRPDGSFVRAHGDVAQGVTFFVTEQAGALLGHTRFQFRCRDVWKVWHDALGRTAGTATPDLTVNALELTNGRPPMQQGNAWRTIQEVENWFDAFDRWFVDAALPRLDRIRRAADLAELALTDAQMQLLPRRGQMTAGERYSRLVLAAAFDSTRLPDWMELLCRPRRNAEPDERVQLKQLAAYLRG